MPKTTVSSRKNAARAVRAAILGASCLTAFVARPAAAFFEPPIQSETDRACREVARSRVFSTPDPEGVGLYETGRRIWTACMASRGEGPGRAVRPVASAR